MNICVLSRLYQAESVNDAARYAQTLANNPDFARLCLIQLAGGAWAVCLVRSDP